MKKTILAAAVLLAAAVPAGAQQYPTIVGNWYEPEYGLSDCGSHMAVTIKPMGLTAIEEVCTFDSVRRDGWRVTWTGQCSAGGRWQDNMTVVATETNGSLRLDWSDGSYIPDLRRCPK